ncbi:MAG: P22-like coat protein [Caudoviricetes sp.]|nr:MAG: P22-like coat protein [Caudoviricetes sp.]
MANTVPSNILQTVQTYQLSGLAAMQNFGFFMKYFNKKFKNFQNETANLGSTVTFDLPPRATTVDSLVADFQPADQRVQPLVVNNSISSSFAFTAEQLIFNVENYKERFVMSGVYEMGSKIEARVAQLAVTNTYRFYGNGVTAINNPTQLAEAVAMYRNYGAISGMAYGVLPDVSIPQIVGGGLAQFAMARNDKLANTWELPMFAECDWFKSNLLPIHVSGSEGTFNQTLTVVSFTTNGPNSSIDTITFSGTHAANDANSIQQFDKLQFKDGVGNFANMRYLTFVGHQVSSNPVQFQATAQAASTAGNQVTVSVYPYLQALPTNEQNLNQQIQVGMQVSVLPSHRAGLIMAKDSGFLAFPQLPNAVPYPTANKVDPITAMSFRSYYGSQLGKNVYGLINDAIYGATLVPEDAMMLAFPI